MIKCEQCKREERHGYAMVVGVPGVLKMLCRPCWLDLSKSRKCKGCHIIIDEGEEWCTFGCKEYDAIQRSERFDTVERDDIPDPSAFMKGPKP